MPNNNDEVDVEAYQDALSERVEDGGGCVETWEALSSDSESVLPRRSVLRSLGVGAGLSAVGLSGVGSVAASTDENSAEELPTLKDLSSDPVGEHAFQLALNPDKPLGVLVAFTQEDGMGLYTVEGVASTSDVPTGVTSIADSDYVYAPQWIDSETVRYWANDAVYERQTDGTSLTEATKKSELTIRDLVDSSEDGITTQAFSFSDCQYISELDQEVCVSSDLFGENLRRDCTTCSSCGNGQTPRLASAALTVKIYDGGNLDYDLGGWIGFNFSGFNACYWSGQEDSEVCARACVGVDGVPAPADIADAFEPILEPAGINPNSTLGLAVAALIIAAIVAFPGPTPV
jgi:hypothetical protein